VERRARRATRRGIRLFLRVGPGRSYVYSAHKLATRHRMAEGGMVCLSSPSPCGSCRPNERQTMARDWRRVELLRSLSTLVSEGLMDMSGVRVALTAYDERIEMQQTLELVIEHEHEDNPVSVDEAYSSIMTGIPLPGKELEETLI